ncbi:hypothetical protein B9Z19DRAFT_1101690 [Tuber borchii]|uniref:Uncharacterized protein n=1 Tax=Tuber borchii TaxID=42251 RepID=A0A2T6ZQS8_TUBBO|nr:hypothetical protein B9Z19DRAFT_1101690 [Tuber borchii]
MCQYELWLYSKCFSTHPSLTHSPFSHTSPLHPHKTFYRVAKCPNSPHCLPPTPRADMKSTSELPIQRRDRYCATCFETLKSSMGGAGDSCWPCGEEHWVDRRLLGGGGGGGGKALVDLEGWNGMDSTVEAENPSRRARLEFLARNWKGWREWGADAGAAIGVSGGEFGA